VLRHNGMLNDILEERMLRKKTRIKKWIKTIDDLIEDNIHIDVKKQLKTEASSKHSEEIVINLLNKLITKRRKFHINIYANATFKHNVK